MTISPNRDSFIIHCDSCSEYLEVESTNFSDAITYIKLNNWKTFKGKDGKWEQKCKACQDK